MLDGGHRVRFEIMDLGTVSVRNNHDHITTNPPRDAVCSAKALALGRIDRYDTSESSLATVGAKGLFLLFL